MIYGKMHIVDTYAWIEYFIGSKKGEKAAVIIDDPNEPLITVECCLAEIRGWSLREVQNFDENLRRVKVKRETRGGAKMETRDIKVNLLFVSTLCLFLILTGMGVASAQEEVAEEGITNSAWIAISAGIVMAASVLAGGWVIIVAIRTIAEKPEVLGHVLILVLLAGVIVVFGLLIAFMLWTKI